MKKLELAEKKCVKCGKLFGRESCRRVSDFKEKKYCSHSCYVNDKAGEKHWNWNGGIKITKEGYLYDRKKGKFVHRIVMEESIGRKLERIEQVHHINHILDDNRIENLVLTKNGEHCKLYHKDAKRDEKGKFKKEA